MNWCFQLYSARHTPLEQSLRLVADAGYKGVEAFRENFADEALLLSVLQDNGLTLPSMHINLPLLRDDWQSCVQRANRFTCRHIVCPFLEEPSRPKDAAGWITLAEELEAMTLRWQEQGCTFAWHNHDFEFFSLEDNSQPMRHLLDNAPSMRWEIDVAWIVRAGADPLEWINAYQRRLSAVHLKDIAPAGECKDEDGWADFGTGVVNWPLLAEPLQSSPAQFYIVEHDNPADLKRFAARSIQSANQLFQP